jgi:hypothetical protein
MKKYSLPVPIVAISIAAYAQEKITSVAVDFKEISGLGRMQTTDASNHTSPVRYRQPILQR